MSYILNVGKAELRVDIVGCVGCGMIPKSDGERESGSPAGSVAVAVGTSRRIAVPLWRCAKCYQNVRSPAVRKALAGNVSSRSGHNKLIILLLALLVPILSGCPMLDGQVLSSTRRYFPAAEIEHYNPAFLHIETHVGHVAPPFVAETWQSFAAKPEFRELQQGMQLAGYRWLVLGFDDYNVLWDSAAPGYISVMDRWQWLDWWTRTIGPPPANTEIVR